MSLLDAIRDGAIECGPDFDTTLRQAHLLATRLGYEPFRVWVESELRGYGKDAELPDYRVVPASIWYHSSGEGHQQKRTAPWDMFTDEAAYKSASSVDVRQSVAQLVSWASEGEDLKFLPAGIAHRHLDVVLHQRQEALVSARQVVSLASIKGILSAICTGLLQFVIEIEKLYPEVSETPLPNHPDTNQAIGRVFNQFIFHGGNPTVGVATGTMPIASNMVSQQSLVLVNTLNDLFREQGIEVDDLAPIVEESTVEDVDREESRVGQWIERASEAARSAGKTISEEALKLAVRQILSGNVDFSVLTSIFG
jgi:AbiTii